MDEYFRYYSIPKEKRLSYCLRQITGEAHQWWIQEEDDRWWYEEPEIISWGQLKWIMRERYAPNSLPQFQYPLEVSNHPHTRQKRFPQAVDRKVAPLATNEPNKEPTTYCPKSEEETCCNVSLPVEKQTTQCSKNDITHLILSREPKTGLGDAKEHITTRNNGVERQQREEQNLNQKNTPSLIYSLLIKEVPLDAQMRFKPNQNQEVLHSSLIKEAHKNSHNQSLPKLIKPQGKLLKYFFHDTNLFSLHVGKSVLRTKLCQEGGNDEDLKSKLNLSGYELESNKEQDASKAGMQGYQAWDPGERMWTEPFNQPKTRLEFQPTRECTSKREFSLNGLLVYKDEDSRFEDMKTLQDEDISAAKVIQGPQMPNHLISRSRIRKITQCADFREMKKLSIFEECTDKGETLDVQEGPSHTQEETPREEEAGVTRNCTLFPLTMVLSQWVFLVRFLTRQ